MMHIAFQSEIICPDIDGFIIDTINKLIRGSYAFAQK